MNKRGQPHQTSTLPRGISGFALGSLVAATLIVMPGVAIGQTTAAVNAAPPVTLADASTSAIPDAPTPTADLQTGTPTATTAADTQPQQTKRILGIIPNFRAVSSDTKLPPQTPKEKFTSTVQETFDYSSFIFVGILAGVDQVENSTPEFHQGAAGYGRYYWHTLADQTDENFMVQFILPVATHEDSRYYTLGRGNIAKRALYAFDRTLITRNDAGNETFNISEVVGAGAAAGISATYYPAADKDWTKTGQLWLENVIIDGGTYVFQEFWPDINNAVFHQKD